MTAPDDLDPGEPLPDSPLGELDPELPEGDVLEQHEAAEPEAVADELDSVPADVPEADAIEQATPVPFDDEDDD